MVVKWKILIGYIFNVLILYTEIGKWKLGEDRVRGGTKIIGVS